jgi:myo-inositol-1-phosphate synthase
MVANTSHSSGTNTPISEHEALASVHPTAVRRPYPIVVQSEQTAYSDEHITAKFTNRGADVVVSQDGQYVVKPTAKSYELQTVRKVPKTG